MRQLTPETVEAVLRAAVEAGSERALARKLGVEHHVIANALRQGCTRKNEEDLRRRMGMPPITPRTHTEGHRITVSHADYEEVLAMDYTAQDIWQLGMETARQMEANWGHGDGPLAVSVSYPPMTAMRFGALWRLNEDGTCTLIDAEAQPQT